MQRYEKVAQLFDLAMDMQASYMGVSLKDICEKFEVSHRTAQRMVRGLETTFPQLEIVEDENREHRWRLPSNQIGRLVNFTADEIATLESAISLLEKSGRDGEAKILSDLERKAQALIKRHDQVKMEPDVEALLQADGLIATPGPTRVVSGEILSPLRFAIKAGVMVSVRYRKREGEFESYTLEPYGFLYGHRHYLIARNPERGDDFVRKYRLGDIQTVECTNDMFERDPDFDLNDYANQSFGVYVDKPEDVEWRFSPAAAKTAASYQFHPSEEKSFNEDGSLTVKFRTSGIQEMAWHLMIWGQDVEVVSPAILAKIVNSQRPEWEMLP